MKHNRKKIYIATFIIVGVLVLLTVAYPKYKEYQKDKEIFIQKDKELFIQYLTTFKCLASCPTKVVSDAGFERNEIDRSCQRSCEQFWSSDDNQQILDSSYLRDKNDFIDKANIECINKMFNPDYKWGECINPIFEKYEYIVDLSDYELEPYTKYDFEITSFECGENKANIGIKITGGDDELKVVRIDIIESGDEYYRPALFSYHDFEAPKVGETIEYVLAYEDIKYDWVKSVNKSSIEWIQIWLRGDSSSLSNRKEIAC